MTGPNASRPDPARPDDGEGPRQPWLLPGDCRRPHDRTLLLEMTTRALFPTVLVFSVYLLLVGHYGPGGGFAAGLVAGLASCCATSPAAAGTSAPSSPSGPRCWWAPAWRSRC